MHTDDGLMLHHAIVHTSDPVTGISTVRIPALLGGQVVTVGHDGLVYFNGAWNVPSPGTFVSVSSTPELRMFSWVISPPDSTSVGALLTSPDPFPQYATDVAMSAAIAAAVAAMQNKLVPAGTVLATVGNTPDVGFFLIDGSTVVSAQTLYPAMWLRIPASWKSGANMVMPDARGRTLFMDDAASAFTLGALSGSNTHTMTASELVSHTHTQPYHNHTVFDPGHFHTPGTLSIPAYNTAHSHSPSGGFTNFVVETLSGPNAINISAGTGATVSQVTTTATAGGTDPNGPFSGQTEGAYTAITLGATVAVNNSTGGTTSFDITNANLCVNFQIKAH